MAEKSANGRRIFGTPLVALCALTQLVELRCVTDDSWSATQPWAMPVLCGDAHGPARYFCAPMVGACGTRTTRRTSLPTVMDTGMRRPRRSTSEAPRSACDPRSRKARPAAPSTGSVDRQRDARGAPRQQPALVSKFDSHRADDDRLSLGEAAQSLETSAQRLPVERRVQKEDRAIDLDVRHVCVDERHGRKRQLARESAPRADEVALDLDPASARSRQQMGQDYDPSQAAAQVDQLVLLLQRHVADHREDLFYAAGKVRHRRARQVRLVRRRRPVDAEDRIDPVVPPFGRYGQEKLAELLPAKVARRDPAASPKRPNPERRVQSDCPSYRTAPTAHVPSAPRSG